MKEKGVIGDFDSIQIYNDPESPGLKYFYDLDLTLLLIIGGGCTGSTTMRINLWDI